MYIFPVVLNRWCFEPPAAAPVIIEDGALLVRIVVEGVRVGEEVIGRHVVLTSSTKIIDVNGDEEKIYKGVVPPRSVVIPVTTTSLPQVPTGSCA